MPTFAQVQGVWKQTPLLELGALIGAVMAVVGERSFLRHVNLQCSVERLDLDALVPDVEKQLTRDKRACTVFGIAIHDNRRRLKLPVQRYRADCVALLGGPTKMHDGKRNPVVVAMLLV